MSDTALRHVQSGNTPATASRTAAAFAGTAAPGSGCGRTPDSAHFSALRAPRSLPSPLARTR
ncbi:hypothetical protein [Streptomyces sp. NRRL S-4]|uniref:hypothetical protein n=1 Tax=Streptomyces sp. NRRL S-4 TaxID=1519471 RepID=UPI00099BF1A0|nr:hypothetical protein [Streptomyces sp. NRRL S-4]QRI43539.1 hypothetical protein [Streptomyces sp. NRRL S-4]